MKSDPAPSLEIKYVPEPWFEFGFEQKLELPRDGLYLYGPPSSEAADSDIRYGVIGTEQGVPALSGLVPHGVGLHWHSGALSTLQEDRAPTRSISRVPTSILLFHFRFSEHTSGRPLQTMAALRYNPLVAIMIALQGKAVDCLVQDAR